MNTLFFTKHNTCNKAGADKHFEWLEETVAKFDKNEFPRKFILLMHEFEGLNYFLGKFQTFFLDEYSHRF